MRGERRCADALFGLLREATYRDTEPVLREFGVAIMIVTFSKWFEKLE